MAILQHAALDAMTRDNEYRPVDVLALSVLVGCGGMPPASRCPKAVPSFPDSHHRRHRRGCRRSGDRLRPTAMSGSPRTTPTRSAGSPARAAPIWVHCGHRPVCATASLPAPTAVLVVHRVHRQAGRRRRRGSGGSHHGRPIGVWILAGDTARRDRAEAKAESAAYPISQD